MSSFYRIGQGQRKRKRVMDIKGLKDEEMSGDWKSQKKERKMECQIIWTRIGEGHQELD